MKRLYLQCAMGCSGDMLFGALLELLPEPEAWLDRFQQAGIPGVRAVVAPCQKCGIAATQVSIQIDGQLEEDAARGHHHVHHPHRHLGDIAELIRSLRIPDTVRDHALAVYELLAQAESRVHGQKLEHVHFHEVGSLDAVADIVGVCWLLDILRPDEIWASPVAVGTGTVPCAHGVLPVPAPATAELLKGIPWYSGGVTGELCTPTGAALLKHFVHRFGDNPTMVTEKIGMGAGHKDFAQANLLRAFWGETAEVPSQAMELCCNLDDMTGEDVGYALEQLWAAKPLDVWTVAAQMKKNRPGVTLHLLCRPEEQDRFARLMLQHTTTAGVRCHPVERYTLETHFTQTETEYGTVQVKHYTGYGVTRSKAEFSDLAQAAQHYGVSLERVRKSLERSDR